MGHSTAINKSCQYLNSRPNPDNHLAQHSSRILLTGALLLVGASAALGSYFGYVIGSQQHMLLGLVFAGAALGGEIVKPYAVSEVVHALSRFNVVRAVACLALAAVCVVYSITAELSLAAGTRGDLAASRQAVADAARDARADRQRAEAELASLPPSRPVAELQADVDGLLLTPGAKGCTKIDGAVQERICPKVATLKAEKARSERRAQLEAAIASTARPAAELPAVRDADPLAGAVAVYAAALGWRLDTQTLLPWLALIPVAFLELGSALAVVVVRSATVEGCSSATQTLDTGTGQPESPAAPAPQVSSRAKPKRRRKGGDDDTGHPGTGAAGHRVMPANVVELLRERGGKLEAGQRAIGKLLGVSKSRVNQVLHELAEAGALVLDTSRSGTRLALA
jgi:hypothetical protein